jgi:hypothetical protein
MIPLYVLYQGIFWFIFVSTIGIFIKDWAWYKDNAAIPPKNIIMPSYFI